MKEINLNDKVRKYVASKHTALQKVVVKVSPHHTPEEIADLLALVLPDSRNEILLTYWEGDLQAFLIPIQYKNEIDNSNLKYEIVEAASQNATKKKHIAKKAEMKTNLNDPEVQGFIDSVADDLVREYEDKINDDVEDICYGDGFFTDEMSDSLQRDVQKSIIQKILQKLSR